jgi:hypothetical protein
VLGLCRVVGFRLGVRRAMPLALTCVEDERQRIATIFGWQPVYKKGVSGVCEREILMRAYNQYPGLLLFFIPILGEVPP